jgi:hypothetical protein
MEEILNQKGKVLKGKHSLNQKTMSNAYEKEIKGFCTTIKSNSYNTAQKFTIDHRKPGDKS